MKRVLIITTKNSSGGTNLQAVRDFTNTLNQGSSELNFMTCAVQELLFGVQGDTVSIKLAGTELHELGDVIHLRNVNLFTDYANAVRLYANHHGIILVNPNDSLLPYYGKVSQGFKMALGGIRTPALLSSPDNQTLLEALKDAPFGYPLVIKHNDGIKGADNYLISTPQQLRKVLKRAKQGFVAQPFIANSGELRVLYFGDNVPPLIFKKQAGKGEYLNNTSRGGSGTLLAAEAVNKVALERAVQAATIMGRSVAGVDVLLGDDGDFYVLEANTTPAIVTGVFPKEKRRLYQAFLEQIDEEK